MCDDDNTLVGGRREDGAAERDTADVASKTAEAIQRHKDRREQLDAPKKEKTDGERKQVWRPSWFGKGEKGDDDSD